MVFDKKNINSALQVIYLIILAPDLGYSPAGAFTRFGHSGMATIGVRG
jgi:hypothetical protein